jgi:hypothetical protein
VQYLVPVVRIPAGINQFSGPACLQPIDVVYYLSINRRQVAYRQNSKLLREADDEMTEVREIDAGETTDLNQNPKSIPILCLRMRYTPMTLLKQWPIGATTR